MQRSSPVLTIGIFAGSNWGVPQGEPYAIIDRTIEKFEEAHPGVRVQYVSGIQREDYAEWLAGEFLRGEEPDVFLLPTEDFELYAEKGGLRELSPLVEQDAEFSTEIYDRAAYQNGQHDGRLYALPCENMITLMFVNKTLLAREGADMPPLSWTWGRTFSRSRSVSRRIRTEMAYPISSVSTTTHGSRQRCPTVSGSFEKTENPRTLPIRAWRKPCAF